MKTKLKSISIVVIILASFLSCKKEGTGGKSTIKGNVKHHAVFIPNATVYIKYGAIDFPGSDVSKYDASVTADANAYYEFKELRKGDYYLYGVGYDSNISENVYGGLSIRLKRNETREITVPVVE